MIAGNIGHQEYTINLVVAHCEAAIFEGKLLDEDSPFNGKVYCTNSMPAMVKQLNALKDASHSKAGRIVLTKF